MTVTAEQLAQKITHHPDIATHFRPKLWVKGPLVRVYLSSPIRDLKPSKVVKGRYSTEGNYSARPRQPLGSLNVTLDKLTVRIDGVGALNYAKDGPRADIMVISECIGSAMGECVMQLGLDPKPTVDLKVGPE